MLKFKLSIIVLIFTLTALVSCSSAPKDTGDVVGIRILAEREMAIGNGEAAQGNFENALAILRESNRKAILVDDVSLMIRSGLSLGNVLFTLGRPEEAFSEWENSIMLAQMHDLTELLSISRIYLLRGRLLTDSSIARQILDEVESEVANINDRNDPLYVAFSWQVRGLALRDLNSFTEAEDAIRRSLDIHERERVLENAAYDWYIIASIRSLSGNTEGALDALNNAMVFDRRVENSWGLATNWRAIGDVHQKAGNNSDALAAYNRSRAIFSAMGNQNAASEVERRIELSRGTFNE